MVTDCLGYLVVYGAIFLIGLGMVVFGVLNILEVTDPTVVANVIESIDMREPFDAFFIRGTNVPPKYGDAYGYCKNLSVCDQPFEKDQCIGNEHQVPYCDQECRQGSVYPGKFVGEFWATKPVYENSIGGVKNTGKETNRVINYPAVCHNGPGLPRVESKTNKCDVLLEYEFEGEGYSRQYQFDSTGRCSQSFPKDSSINIRYNPDTEELTPIDEQTSEQRGFIFIGVGCVIMLMMLPSVMKTFTKTGCEQLKKEALLRMRVVGNIAEATANGLARSGRSSGGGGWGGSDDGVGAPSM